MKTASLKKAKFFLSSILVLVLLGGIFTQAISSNVFQDKQTKKETTTKSTKSETQVKQKEAEKLICAVTGEEADPKLKMEYKGETYYFCCKKCVKKFKENPEKYIKPKS